MANEVINPFQLYRDDKGVPLAGGSLTIFVPGTSTLGTAFSDSALSIPQTVKNYALDNFGRVQGDLRWSGLRDVEVFDSSDEFIRRNVNVVTLIDSSSFPINHVSVAAMVADTTLVVGDVVETQSYNANQNEGGARYIIVAGGTGSNDGYIFHNLDNALQAELLDQDRNANFFVAGAIGTGTTDDSAFVQTVLNFGGDIECANGTFAVQSLTLNKDARIHGNGVLIRFAFSNAVVITLSGVDLTITFDGVTLDGNLTNQASEQSIAIVNSTITASAGTTQSIITFNNVNFQNGSLHDVLGTAADTAFPVLYKFAQCNFLSGEEGSATPFVTASISMQTAADCVIEQCYFNIETTPTTGRSAVLFGTANAALTNPGYLSVDGCTMNLMGLTAVTLADARGAIHVREATEVTLRGNRLLGPVSGGIVFGAEVSNLIIADNMVDAVSGGVVYGGIVSISTTNTAPGENWLINNNELVSIGAIAILIDGTTGGADVSRVTLSNNLIDGPTLQAITYTDVIDLSIISNYINMEALAATDAILAVTNGAAGNVTFKGNQIVNLGTTSDGITDTISVAGTFVFDGNTFDTVVDGIRVTGGPGDVFITNNTFNEVTGDLITVGNLDSCYIDGNSLTGTAVPTTFTQNTGSITKLVVGENLWTQLDNSITQIAVTGSNITAGPIEAHFHEFVATGATSIDTLTDPAVDGYIVVLQNTAVAAVTMTELGNMNLGAATRVLTDATDTLTLAWNETNSEWNELSYSDN